MKLARSALALLVLPALASVAVADVEVPLVDSLGNDSGWTAYLTDDFNSDLTVVAVTDTFVSIEISHNYLTPPVDGHFGGCLVLFEQRLDDADTLSTI